MAPPNSPLIQRPAPSFEFPTPFTLRDITATRQHFFQRFLEMPTKGSFIENPAAMLRALRALFSKCQPGAAEAGLKAVDYFERIYPVGKQGADGKLELCERSDHTPERCHPLAVAWWLAYSGAPADVVVACLYHDAVEDGKLCNLEQWLQQTGIQPDSPEGAFLQSAWRKIDTLTRPPVVQDGINLNNELRALLQSPADFRNPRVQEILSILMAKQENYVTGIYRSTGPRAGESEGIMTALIKVFDTLYNTRSLAYLNPMEHFSRFYNTLRKAFSHLEPLKKLNHELARQILLAIGHALERLSRAGIGPAQVPELHQLYWYHVCQQSPYQRRVEHRGFADCGLRSVCNPDINTYARTAISKFGPEPKDALLLVDTPEHPAQPLEFEVPVHVRNEPWWNFFTNTFRHVDMKKLEKAIAVAFPSRRFTFHQQPSYLPPLLAEFLIWRFEPPKMLFEKARQLFELSAGASEFSDLRVAAIMEEYERFNRQVRRGLRYIYKKVVRGPAIPHYFSVALMLAHQRLNRLIGVRLPHTESRLPAEH